MTELAFCACVRSTRLSGGVLAAVEVAVWLSSSVAPEPGVVVCGLAWVWPAVSEVMVDMWSVGVWTGMEGLVVWWGLTERLGVAALCSAEVVVACSLMVAGVESGVPVWVWSLVIEWVWPFVSLRVES